MWKSGSIKSFWLRGFPGSGKTILSFVFVRRPKEDNASPCPCLYFYFDFSDLQKQLLENLIKSLFQLLNYKQDAARQSLACLYKESSDG